MSPIPRSTWPIAPSPLSASKQPTDEALTLALSHEQLIETGEALTVELRGDINDGACDVLAAHFAPEHSTATGVTYGLHSVWQKASTSQPPIERVIAGKCD